MRIYLMLAGAFLMASLNIFAQEELPKVKVKSPKIKADKESIGDVAPTGGTSRFLIKAYGAYGFVLGNTYNFFSERGDNSDNFISSTIDTNGILSARSGENTNGLGTGPRVGIGFAYIVNDFINLGIDIDYLTSEISRSRLEEVTIRSPQVKRITSSQFSYTAKVFALSPHVVFKAISRNNVYVYTRLGAVISPSTQLDRIDKINTKFVSSLNPAVVVSDTTGIKKYDLSLKLPFGFLASFGANFKLTSRMRFLVEAQYTTIFFTPKTRTLVNYTENGVDKLLAKFPTPYSRQDVFKKEFNITRNLRAPNDVPVTEQQNPREVPGVRVPVTNYSISAGVTYRF